MPNVPNGLSQVVVHTLPFFRPDHSPSLMTLLLLNRVFPHFRHILPPLLRSLLLQRNLHDIMSSMLLPIRQVLLARRRLSGNFKLRRAELDIPRCGIAHKGRQLRTRLKILALHRFTPHSIYFLPHQQPSVATKKQTYIEVLHPLPGIHKRPDLAVIRVEATVVVHLAQGSYAVAFVVFFPGLVRRKGEPTERFLEAGCWFEHGGDLLFFLSFSFFSQSFTPSFLR